MSDKFPRIPFKTLLRYGTDKPDLELSVINDITNILKETITNLKFSKINKIWISGKSYCNKNTTEKPRSFCDKIDKWSKEPGASGLAYFTIEKDKVFKAKGPVGKFFGEEAIKELMRISKASVGDSVFMACGKEHEIETILSLARQKIAKDLSLIDENIFAFCWIVDYPMYELDKKSNKIVFSHNPFSMPQGEIKTLNFEKPLEIKAYQYDIVCNGVELSSGAIRIIYLI